LNIVIAITGEVCEMAFGCIPIRRCTCNVFLQMAENLLLRTATAES